MNEDIFIDWGSLPLIPDGTYEAVYVKHETFHQSFGPKIKITFRITTLGEYYETLLFGWYNAKRLKSKPAKGGAATLSRHSKLAYELIKVIDVKERVSRLSPAQLKSVLLQIKVRTVKTNSKQQELSKVQHYSVVDSIIGALTTNKFDSPDLRLKVLPVPVPIPEPAPTIKQETPRQI